MVGSLVLDRVLDFGFKKAKEILTNLEFSLDIQLSDIQESLNIHLSKCRNWAGEISFKDVKEKKSLSDIYIHLDLEVIPARQKIDLKEKVNSIKLKDLSFKENIVLLGQPGAGKTTSLKYLIENLLYESENSISESISYPVLIKFRELNLRELNSYDQIITNELLNIFGFSISKKLKKDKKKITEEELSREIKVAKEKLIISFLQSQNILLILDGFDELPNLESKEGIIKEVKLLTESIDNSKIIISSRSGDFNYHIPNTRELEIQPLSVEQIKEFSFRWLNNEEEAQNFISKVKESPFFDTAIRPLTIAHLCAIYERIKDIPKKPKTVYRKVIDLMLEEWDQQRAIKRASNYATFEIDRKHDFLCAFSFDLSEANSKNLFSKQEMVISYNHICDNFELPRGEAKKVINELETHTGLFLQTGFDSFIFAHKSLQEFLMAEFIVKLPSLPDEDIIQRFPNEMAIAISISSLPGKYLLELIRKCHHAFEKSPSFFLVFVDRLIIEKPDFDYSLETGLTLLQFFQYCITQLSKTFRYIANIDLSVCLGQIISSAQFQSPHSNKLICMRSVLPGGSGGLKGSLSSFLRSNFTNRFNRRNATMLDKHHG